MSTSTTAINDEADRLARLRELVILDSAPEAVFDAIARMASEVCGAPIALISLIDAERQWFKANVGLPGMTGTARDIAFCDQTIRSDAVLEIPDTHQDLRFSTNPLVTAEPSIRFYAGAPLVLAGGQRVGSLCVLDREVRTLNAAQISTLRSLAEIVSQTLAMRRDLIDKALAVRAEQERAVLQSERFMRLIADSLPIRIAYVDASLKYRFVNQAQCDRYGLTRLEILGHSRSELKNSANNPLIDARVKAVLRGEAQFFQFDESTAQGVRKIDSTLTPDVLANGEVAGFFTTGIDVTERVDAERALHELNAIIENTTDFVTQINHRGTVTYMNPAARRACGIALDAPLGVLNYQAFNTERTLRLHAEVIFPALENRGVWVGESTVYGENKREIPVSHMVIAHRNAQGRIERYSTVMRDITVENTAKLEVLRQMNTLRSVTEAISESVAVVGADLRYRFVNSAFERSMATPRENIIGHTMREVLGRDAFLHSLPQLARALAGETVSFESTFDGADGSVNLSISHAPLRVDQERVDSVVTVARDTTLQKREEMRLRELSQRDPLTGLLNRAGFDKYLGAALADGGGPSLALLYIDLDQFKPINDQHGHAVGDQVLQLFAERLRRTVRPSDGVARIGGDEFAIILSGIRDRAVAHAVAEKVLASVKTPFAIGELTLSISASIGVAFGVAFGVALDGAFGVTNESGWPALVARADANLYKAKAAGRGRYFDDAAGPA